MTDQQQKAIAPSNSGSDRSHQSNYPSHHNHSSKLQRSGKGKPCPICNRTKDSDCCWNDEVVLCHTYTDQDAQASGYVYRGVKDIWGQYFPVDESAPKPIRPQARKEFIYKDVDGTPLVRVTRIDDGAGQKKIFQSHWNGTQWVKGLTPEVKAKLRLYRINDPITQDAIAHSKPVLIVEGEGKVDLLLNLGIAATCSIAGAGKWRKYGYPNYLEDLKGAVVVLCPDRDEPGVKHCLEIEQDLPNSQWLYAFPDSPVWDNLPKKNGLDVADWVTDDKLDAEQILSAIGPKRDLTIGTQTTSQEKDTEKADKPTIAQLLLAIAEQGVYFHTPVHKAHVDIHINGVRQTFPVRSKTFKQWLQRELFVCHQKMAGSESLNQVLGVLEAKANFEGAEIEAHLRIAEQDGKVYLDLGTDNWQAVEISSKGWKIVSDYPVRFRRTAHLLPLPMPKSGGHVSELRELLNLDDDGWILVMVWLLFSFYPKYPHPLLILHGEQGTGKSFSARLLKTLVDPGKAPLIPDVADLRNLAVAAGNRWVMVYDNLSHVTASQSDALCRISTGGGFSTRTLYENDEETVFEFIRPQILTGIDELASRGDLLERSLIVKLLTISEEERLTEAELEAKLDKVQGRILGALLTALSQTLKQLPDVQADRLPRMADFGKFAIASETALDLPVGSFLQAYAKNRYEAHEAAIESSPVAVAIQRLMQYRASWQGAASELLDELQKLVDENTTKRRTWPGSPKALGKALTRLAPDLRGMGIDIVRPTRGSQKRLIRLEKSTSQTSQTSLMSQASQDKASGDDITETLNVTESEPNVTRDMSERMNTQTSLHDTANVTTEPPALQAIQPLNDKCDMSDKKKVTQSNCGGWVFSKQLGTQVELLSVVKQRARVRVPGMGVREVNASDLEVLPDSVA